MERSRPIVVQEMGCVFFLTISEKFGKELCSAPLWDDGNFDIVEEGGEVAEVEEKHRPIVQRVLAQLGTNEREVRRISYY